MIGLYHICCVIVLVLVMIVLPDYHMKTCEYVRLKADYISVGPFYQFIELAYLSEFFFFHVIQQKTQRGISKLRIVFIKNESPILYDIVLHNLSSIDKPPFVSKHVLKYDTFLIIFLQSFTKNKFLLIDNRMRRNIR